MNIAFIESLTSSIYRIHERNRFSAPYLSWMYVVNVQYEDLSKCLPVMSFPSSLPGILSYKSYNRSFCQGLSLTTLILKMVLWCFHRSALHLRMSLVSFYKIMLTLFFVIVNIIFCFFKFFIVLISLLICILYIFLTINANLISFQQAEFIHIPSHSFRLRPIYIGCSFDWIPFT